MKKHGKEIHRPRVPPNGAKYISAPQVCDRYGGRSHMWLVRKLETDPRFPRPTYFGRLRFFKIAELEAYERAAAGGEGSRDSWTSNTRAEYSRRREKVEA
jgi:hypothetical protein